jgi:predicted ATP-grasp superfamily ATP-dependent carboligase
VSEPLAIVGASTRAAAASALRAGYQPVTADLFADADLRLTATATRIAPYPDGFLDWLRTIDPPAWMYTGALENHPELVDQMAWLAPLWGNPGDVLQLVRSPATLANALRTSGLLFPETRTSLVGLPQDGTWLAKTYQGASGSGVRELSKEQGAGSREKETHNDEGRWTMDDGKPIRHSSFGNSSFSVLPAPRSPLPAYFQQRIPGTSGAAVFVAAAGAATLLGLTCQLIGEPWLGAHGFQYAGSIGPLAISETALAALKKIGITLAARFELVGLFGVDFILAGDEVWTIEVNPRFTASVEIVERVTGVPAIAAHAQACINGWLGSSVSEPPGFLSQAHGKAILFARRDITLTAAFADWTLAEATRTPWPTLADVSSAGTHIAAGRPILTLFAAAATPAAVEARLRQRVAEIEQRVYADSRITD